MVVNRVTRASSDWVACNASSARLRSEMSIVVARNNGGWEFSARHGRHIAVPPDRRAVLAPILLYNVVVCSLPLLEFRKQRSGTVAILFEAEIESRERSKLLVRVAEHGQKGRYLPPGTGDSGRSAKCPGSRSRTRTASAPRSPPALPPNGGVSRAWAMTSPTILSRAMTSSGHACVERTAEKLIPRQCGRRPRPGFADRSAARNCENARLRRLPPPEGHRPFAPR